MAEVRVPYTHLTLRPPPGMRFLQAMEDGRQCVKFEYPKGKEKDAVSWFENWILNHLIPPPPSEPVVLKSVPEGIKEAVQELKEEVENGTRSIP